MTAPGKFNISFAGTIAEGFDARTVKQAFALKFKLPPEKVDKYFSGKSIVLKKDVPQEQAEKISRMLAGIGVVVNLEPIPAPADAGLALVVDEEPAETGAAQTNMAERQFQLCPSCGQQQAPERLECESCGMVMEKVRAKAAQNQSNPAQESQVEDGTYIPAQPVCAHKDFEADMRSAAIAAFISAVLTGLMGLGFWLVFGSELGGFWSGPAILLEALVIAGCGVGLLKKSRVAAILIFVYFVLGKILFYMEAGQLSGIVFTLIFAYYFYKGMVASFAYHQYMREQDADYPAVHKLEVALGAPAAVFMVAMLLGSGTGLDIPEGQILSGENVAESDLVLLRENGLLDEGETIVYIHSGAMAGMEQGNVLTDRKVFSYFSFDDEVEHVSLYLDEIEHVEVSQDEDGEPGTQLIIQGGEEEIFMFLPGGDGSDKRFVAELERRRSGATGSRVE